MKKQTIIIAGIEFVATDEGYRLLYAYLSKAWWVYAFRRTAYRENITTVGTKAGSGSRIHKVNFY